MTFRNYKSTVPLNQPTFSVTEINANVTKTFDK